MTTLADFVAEVGPLVASGGSERELAEAVAGRLSALLAAGYRPPRHLTRPDACRHVTYPLYLAPDGGWSMACVVWDVGQRTGVHSHETWGVAAVCAGAETERRYRKPAPGDPPAPLPVLGEREWLPGQVTVCCTTDDDVHAVTATGTEPTVGIHVYGGDIGALRRREYDPETGAVTWFASGWDSPSEPAAVLQRQRLPGGLAHQLVQ